MACADNWQGIVAAAGWAAIWSATAQYLLDPAGSHPNFPVWLFGHTLLSTLFKAQLSFTKNLVFKSGPMNRCGLSSSMYIAHLKTYNTQWKTQNFTSSVESLVWMLLWGVEQGVTRWQRPVVGRSALVTMVVLSDCGSGSHSSDPGKQRAVWRQNPRIRIWYTFQPTSRTGQHNTW